MIAALAIASPAIAEIDLKKLERKVGKSTADAAVIFDKPEGDVRVPEQYDGCSRWHGRSSEAKPGHRGWNNEDKGGLQGRGLRFDERWP